jgi:WD40 repeat protein
MWLDKGCGWRGLLLVGAVGCKRCIKKTQRTTSILLAYCILNKIEFKLITCSAAQLTMRLQHNTSRNLSIAIVLLATLSDKQKKPCGMVLLTREVAKKMAIGCVFKDNQKNINSMSFSFDGHRLVTAGDDDAINVYDARCVVRQHTTRFPKETEKKKRKMKKKKDQTFIIDVKSFWLYFPAYAVFLL